MAVLAIDPEKEWKFSNPENKLVKFRITKESIDLLKRTDIFTVMVADNVELKIDDLILKGPGLSWNQAFQKMIMN